MRRSEINFIVMHSQSGRGLPHSKTLRTVGNAMARQRLGLRSPLALLKKE
jgi:hypothetical protein